ncbi:MAG: helix-turn-helix domain-containing protein, partial [candidate division WOR-3 bacterium]
MWQQQDVPKKARDNRIQRAVDLIHSKPSGKLAVQELAKRVCMSRKHFERVFKKETGVCPKSYMIAIKLEKARQLVADSDLTIGEIGEQMGFSDPRRFRKHFKEHTGLLPSEYRKLRRSTSEPPRGAIKSATPRVSRQRHQ